MKNIFLLYKVIPDKNKIFFWTILILTFGKSVFDLIGLGSLVPLIYAIFDQESLISNKYLVFLNLSQYSELKIIYYSTAFIFLIFLIKNIYIFFYNYLLVSFLNSVFNNLSKKIFSNSLDLFDGSSYEYNSSELVKVIYQEINAYSSTLLNNIFTICTDLVFIFLLLGILSFQKDGLLLLFILPLFLLGYIYYNYFKKYTKAIGAKRLEYDTHRLKGLKDTFDLLKIIKVLKKTDNFKYYVERYTYKSAEQGKRFVIISRLLSVIIEMSIISVFCISIYFFSNNIEQFKSLLPLIVLILFSSIKFMPMLSRLTLAFQKLKFHENLIKKLDSLSHKSILKKFENKKDIEFNNQIEFQKVSFFYAQENDNKMIFDNLNIKIEKNQCIGIIGPSGSGKSTLLEIFCGLLETSSGSIYYDGKELNQAQARFSTSYVSQDTRILNTTLKKNITLNFKNVDREFNEAKYKNAIEKSNVSNFINQLNNKDDTLLGDLGSSISGGQRQRIGIARAIYHDAEILILDEFTSSLDEKNEKSILQDVKLIKNFKTIIMSTHKKDILTICDRVYKIDQKNLKIL